MRTASRCIEEGCIDDSVTMSINNDSNNSEMRRKVCINLQSLEACGRDYVHFTTSRNELHSLDIIQDCDMAMPLSVIEAACQYSQARIATGKSLEKLKPKEDRGKLVCCNNWFLVFMAIFELNTPIQIRWILEKERHANSCAIQAWTQLIG